jgi:hypothetical protein
MIICNASRLSCVLRVERTEAIFQTSFFNVFRRYLKATGKGAGFLEVVLNLSTLDARSLHAELG